MSHSLSASRALPKRHGYVFCKDQLAGELGQQQDGTFCFFYHQDYLMSPTAFSVSLTLPLQKEPFTSPYLFSFFHGLLAEGELKKIQCRDLKIDEKDDFGRLLKTAGHDTIGDVLVKEAL